MARLFSCGWDGTLYPNLCRMYLTCRIMNHCVVERFVCLVFGIDLCVVDHSDRPLSKFLKTHSRSASMLSFKRFARCVGAFTTHIFTLSMMTVNLLSVCGH